MVEKEIFLMFLLSSSSSTGSSLGRSSMTCQTFGWAFLEVRAFGAQVPRFLAVEVESFLNALLVFFGGEFADFDNIDICGVRVSGFGGSGGRLVGLVGRFGVLFGDFIGAFPLGLKRYGFFIPAVDGGGDCPWT